MVIWFRSKERISGTSSRPEELVLPTSRFSCSTCTCGMPTGVHDGEAVVDRVGREQTPIDERERALGFQPQSCLPVIAVDAGGKQGPRATCIAPGRIRGGVAGGDIGLVAPVADLRRRLLHLDLRRAVRRRADADRAALAERDGQADLQPVAAAGAGQVAKLGGVDRHAMNLDRIAGREYMECSAGVTSSVDQGWARQSWSSPP